MKIISTHSIYNNPILGITLLCLALMGTLAALLSTPMRHLPDDSHFASKGYWMPPHGEASSLKFAQTQNYKPLEGMLIKGNLHNEVWLKVQIKNDKIIQAGSRETSNPLVLMVGPAYLYQADVYIQTANKHWSKVSGGYAKKWHSGPVPLSPQKL